MRKFPTRSRTRVAWVGIASVATATAAVAITATPAFAASTLSSVNVIAGQTITLTDASLAGVAAPGVQFRDSACTGSVVATPSGSVVTGLNITKANASDTSLTVTVPSVSTGASGGKTWYVCPYATTSIGAALTDAGAGASLTVNAMTPNAGPNGTVVQYSDPGITSANTSPGVQLRDSTCAGTTYGATSLTVFNGTTITKPNDNSVQFTTPSLTFGSNGVSKPWYVCVYASTTAGAALITGATTAQFTAYSAPTVSPTTGVSGGGNTVTVTSASNPIFTNVTTPAALFVNGQCPTAYAAPGSFVWPANSFTPYSVAATVTKSTTAPNTTATVVVPAGVVGTGSTATSYNLCLYANSSGGSLLAAAPYSVTVPAISLSSASGPYNVSTNGITVQSTTNFLTGITAPGATFTTGTTCPQVYRSSGSGNVAVVSANVRKLANNRVAITVPALPLTSNAPTPYLACVYNGSTPNTSTLLTAAAYTSTILANPTAITPGAGPATGGTTITVTGTDFPTTPGSITSASLGGVALTNITPVNSTSFTATTGSRPVQDDVPLTVTTGAGTKTLQAAFDYVNSLTVSPNTAPNTTSSIDVSVTGMGFYGMTFGTSAGQGRVFLMDGTYNGADIGAGVRANGPTQECTNVLVITDGELICNLSLNTRLNADATLTVFNPVTYTRTLTSAIATNSTKTITTIAAEPFQANDVGQAIYEASPSNIPAGAYITAVLSPTKATISATASTTQATPFTVTIGASPVHTVAATTFTIQNGVNTVTAPAGTFTNADINRVISGTPGIPNGTIITAVAPGGASATLSQNASANAATRSLTLTSANSSTALTGAAFTTGRGGDVGAVIGSNSLNITPGTSILSVTNGTTAVLSAASTGTGSGPTATTVSIPLFLYPSGAVPEGAYNMVAVSNADADAVNTDDKYMQTAVSSSSTFTVSGF